MSDDVAGLSYVKRPRFVSHRGHIYNQTTDRGTTLNKTVVIYYLLVGLYAFIGIAISQIGTRYALVVYIAVFIISALLV